MTSQPAAPADVATAAAEAGDDVTAGLSFALRTGRNLPQPGAGDTRQRWASLAAAGAADLTAARILEAHSDALAILHEAGEPAPDGTWGVFAAEMPGVRLEWRDGRLRGTKPWCSLGDRLDAALITAFVGDERQLFAVDLHADGVRPEPAAGWVARGLAHVTSTSVHFDGVPARPVGDVGWYLRRPGFAWGGIGVAACWFGGAVGLQRSLHDWAAQRSGDLPPLHVGIVDTAMHGARSALQQAAAAVDSGVAAGADGALLALRVRAVVAAAAEATLHQVGHALGPAPLSFDEPHARRVADLGLYLRQHHGERDLAALGAAALAAAAPSAGSGPVL